jgi:hypothetical protein
MRRLPGFMMTATREISVEAVCEGSGGAAGAKRLPIPTKWTFSKGCMYFTKKEHK